MINGFIDGKFSKKIGIKQKIVCKKFLIEKPQQQPFFPSPFGVVVYKNVVTSVC
jgi:hypothetical protein